MTQQSPTIEFWFDFSSPYAFFASLSIEEIAARHRRSVQWRPFMLGVLFKATGMTSLTQTPLRGDYAKHDWLRLARRAGVVFNPPESHPATQLPASRAFYWIESKRPELAVPFAKRVFQSYFSAGHDTAQPDRVAAIASDLGIAATAVIEAIALPAAKEEVRARTDEALRRGIFGSPFFVVDGEPFWGHDRLTMLDEWLQRGGW
jgi:2-hydroxychromene-2-carboxylate isomerase